MGTSYIKLCLLGLLCLASYGSFAQQPNVSKTTTMLASFQPLFLLNNAIKLDLDLQPKGQLKYVGGLELYTGKTNLLYKENYLVNDQPKDEISGFGINLAIKYSFRREDRQGFFYVSPGLTYRNLSVDVKGPMYYTYVENSLEYYSYGYSERNFKLNPILISTSFGYQAILSDIAFVDLYVGLGYKIVEENEELVYLRNYHTPTFGFNYNGLLLLAGVKIGAKIR